MTSFNLCVCSHSVLLESSLSHQVLHPTSGDFPTKLCTKFYNLTFSSILFWCQVFQYLHILWYLLLTYFVYYYLKFEVHFLAFRQNQKCSPIFSLVFFYTHLLLSFRSLVGCPRCPKLDGCLSGIFHHLILVDWCAKGLKKHHLGTPSK